MKLSESIRLGAMNRPQGFLYLQREGRTCALGAALDAIGVYDEKNYRYDVIDREWPWLHNVLVPKQFPAPLLDWLSGEGSAETIWWVITKANDEELMTREQIADWVETIERAHEQQQQPVSVEA